jgi:hypothetical protein
MKENDRRIRLCLDAVSGEKWFREGKKPLEMRVLAPWTDIPNQVASEKLHFLLPIYDIATENIRIESLVQQAGVNPGIALTSHCK